MSCVICEESNDGYTLKCNGPCRSFYHVTCLGNKNAAYKNALINQYISKIPNLRWFCDSCVHHPFIAHVFPSGEYMSRLMELSEILLPILTMLSPGSLDGDANLIPPSGSIADAGANGATESADTDGITDKSTEPMVVSDEDNTATDQQNQQQIQQQQLQSQHSNSNDAFSSPAANENHFFANNVNTVRRGKRLNGDLQEDLTQGVVQDPKHRKLSSSLGKWFAKPATTVEPTIASTSTANTNVTRSLYITPFLPSTEPSAIVQHLRNNETTKHVANEIVCTKLLSSRFNKKYLTFVSFKLDVPRQYYDLFANPEIWNVDNDVEFTIKEFVKRDVTSKQPVVRTAASNSKQHSKNNISNNNMKQFNNPKNDIVYSKRQRKRTKTTQMRQDNVNRVPHSQPNRQHHHPNVCTKSCCGQKVHQTQSRRNSHYRNCAENPPTNRQNPFRRYCNC